MAQVQFGKVPVLDFKLNCNSRAVEVSLWRDEALIEVLNGDTVELTHLRPNTKPNGNIKFNSSTYTTVKVHYVMHNIISLNQSLSNSSPSHHYTHLPYW